MTVDYANRYDFKSFDVQPEPDKIIDLKLGQYSRIKLEEGQTLRIYTHDGTPLCKIRKNAQGNSKPFEYGKGHQTFSMVYTDGRESLIPVPLEPDNVFTVEKKSIVIGTDTLLRPVSDRFGKNLAGLHFEIQTDSEGYVTIKCLEGRKGTSFMVSGNEESRVVLKTAKQVSKGCDGVIRETFEDGTEVCVLTDRELGKSKYHLRNEDNGGVNRSTQTVAVADGVGGHANGEHASHLCVKALLGADLRNKRDVDTVLAGAKYDLDLLNYFVNRLGVDEQMEEGMEYRRLCDAVFGIMVKVREGVMVVTTGDVLVQQIRDNQVTKSTPLYTDFAERVRAGMVTEAEAWRDCVFDFREDGDDVPVSDRVLNSLGGVLVNPYKPYITVFHVRDGDRIVMRTDGYRNLQDDEVASYVSGVDAQKGAENCASGMTQINNNGVYTRVFSDDTFGEVHAEYDNGTVVVMAVKNGKP